LGYRMEETHPNVGAMSSWKFGYQAQWKIQRGNFGDA